jgi:hypothetical protein
MHYNANPQILRSRKTGTEPRLSEAHWRETHCWAHSNRPRTDRQYYQRWFH